MKGAWYRSLVASCGESRVSVGSVPWHEDEAMWVSSRDEEEPTNDEHARFYAAVRERLESFTTAHLSGIEDSLRRPHVAGDFFCCRSEELLLDPAALAGRLDGLVGTIDVLQQHLAQVENARWRLGYFCGDATLLIYPDAVCVGPRRFETADGAREILRAWLAFMTRNETQP